MKMFVLSALMSGTLLPDCHSIKHSICGDSDPQAEHTRMLSGDWTLKLRQDKSENELRLKIHSPNKTGGTPIAFERDTRSQPFDLVLRVTEIESKLYCDVTDRRHPQWGHFIILAEKHEKTDELRLLALNLSKLKSALRKAENPELAFELKPQAIGMKHSAIMLPLSWTDSGMKITAGREELRRFRSQLDRDE